MYYILNKKEEGIFTTVFLLERQTFSLAMFAKSVNFGIKINSRINSVKIENIHSIKVNPPYFSIPNLYTPFIKTNSLSITTIKSTATVNCLNYHLSIQTSFYNSNKNMFYFYVLFLYLPINNQLLINIKPQSNL